MNGTADGRRLPREHENTVVPAVAIESPSRSSYDRPLVILAILFFATAALGLPLLWFSASFSRRAKALWSVVVIIYTAVILWLFGLLMLWCYHRIAPFF